MSWSTSEKVWASQVLKGFSMNANTRTACQISQLCLHKWILCQHVRKHNFKESHTRLAKSLLSAFPTKSRTCVLSPVSSAWLVHTFSDGYSPYLSNELTASYNCSFNVLCSSTSLDKVIHIIHSSHILELTVLWIYLSMPTILKSHSAREHTNLASINKF